MVDYDMLRRLYPAKQIFDNKSDDLGEEAMAKSDPPDEEFLMLLPPHVYGFEIEYKVWRKFAT